VTVERPGLTVPMIITAALIDGINPCAFAVLIFLLLSILSMESKRRILVVGSAYIGAVFVFYFLSGLGLFTLVQISGVSRWFSIIAAGLALAAGLLTLRDAFSSTAGPLMAIPVSTKGILDRYIKKSTIPAALVLGVLVGMFELPCTGGIYLAILSMLSGSMTLAAGIPLLLLYNLVFVLPLVLILGIVYFGVAPEKLESWRVDKKRAIRVLMGLLMIGLGAFLLIRAL
jgi:cytochrome c biogenesis protein CcdA